MRGKQNVTATLDGSRLPEPAMHPVTGTRKVPFQSKDSPPGGAVEAPVTFWGKSGPALLKDRRGYSAAARSICPVSRGRSRAAQSISASVAACSYCSTPSASNFGFTLSVSRPTRFRFGIIRSKRKFRKACPPLESIDMRRASSPSSRSSGCSAPMANTSPSASPTCRRSCWAPSSP